MPVWLKMDCMQPPGSFKIRGVGMRAQRALASGAEHLVSSSGGNAGLATAYAGRRLGLPVTVVLPTTTPAFVQDRLRAYGAEPVVHGSVWDEANEYAMDLAEDVLGVLIHPFDHPDLFEGHASLVAEVREQLLEEGQDEPPGAFVTVVAAP